MAERFLRLREEAVYLVEAGNYDDAYQKLVAAQVIYDTTPNQEREQLRMEFRSIEALMQRIEKLRNASRTSSTVQVQRIEYRRPTLCER